MVSIFKDAFSKDQFQQSPEWVMNYIISEDLREWTEYLRNLDKDEFKTEKLKTMAVTWSGVFKKGMREIKGLEKYSGLVVVDLDRLDDSTLQTVKSQLSQDEYIRFMFVSPSGQGLKFVVQVNTGPESHRGAFLHIKKYFEDKYLIKIDDSGKDVSRLCFLSWDPSAMINLQSKVFEVDLKYGEITPFHQTSVEGVKAVTEVNKVFEVCTMWVNRTKQYFDGNRNNYIHALACALNRCGVSQEDTLRLFSEHFSDLDDHERKASVRSAYFHNQAEHGTVAVRDIGGTDFVAPPYIANYTDDVAANDLMRITGTLYHHKVPNNEIMDVVSKIAKFYDSQGYIDLRRASVVDLMNQAVNVLRQNITKTLEQTALEYTPAENMLLSILASGGKTGCVSTGLDDFDREMFGGMTPGNVYGIIGMPESYKSILAQRICFVNAMNGVPSVYLNSEMSAWQYYERLIYMAFGYDMRKMMDSGQLSQDTAADFIEKFKEITGNNIFVVNSSGHDKQAVMSTIETISQKEGKEIKILVSDGITHWSWGRENEINAAINNSLIAKDVAKEANGGKGIVHIALIHISGDIKRHFRDTGKYVRGGKKILANLDAYFSTSRLISPETADLVNEDDIVYIPDKFYLRYIDKRSRTGVVSKIINVGAKLSLEVEHCDPSVYELKLQKK
jgi:hypothetical protein